MAMRKHPARFRAIRPAAENLEHRQLLSGTVTGVNTEGDAWTLTLVGPGSIKVTKQTDTAGNPTGLNDRERDQHHSRSTAPIPFASSAGRHGHSLRASWHR